MPWINFVRRGEVPVRVVLVPVDCREEAALSKVSFRNPGCRLS